MLTGGSEVSDVLNGADLDPGLVWFGDERCSRCLDSVAHRIQLEEPLFKNNMTTWPQHNSAKKT